MHPSTAGPRLFRATAATALRLRVTVLGQTHTMYASCYGNILDHTTCILCPTRWFGATEARPRQPEISDKIVLGNRPGGHPREPTLSACFSVWIPALFQKHRLATLPLSARKCKSMRGSSRGAERTGWAQPLFLENLNLEAPTNVRVCIHSPSYPQCDADAMQSHGSPWFPPVTQGQRPFFAPRICYITRTLTFNRPPSPFAFARAVRVAVAVSPVVSARDSAQCPAPALPSRQVRSVKASWQR